MSDKVVSLPPTNPPSEFSVGKSATLGRTGSSTLAALLIALKAVQFGEESLPERTQFLGGDVESTRKTEVLERKRENSVLEQQLRDSLVQYLESELPKFYAMLEPREFSSDRRQGWLERTQHGNAVRMVAGEIQSFAKKSIHGIRGCRFNTGEAIVMADQIPESYRLDHPLATLGDIADAYCKELHGLARGEVSLSDTRIEEEKFRREELAAPSKSLREQVEDRRQIEKVVVKQGPLPLPDLIQRAKAEVGDLRKFLQYEVSIPEQATTREMKGSLPL